MHFIVKFHPVGFGLFTSGEIGNFKFVYDCGSTSTAKVNNCIDKEFAECKHLDLIVISHFHRDHINGLKRLFEKVEHIDTIILPYLTPRERLNYMLTLDLDYLDDWIPSFIIDPAKTLLEFGRGKSNIVFISGGPDKYFDENKNDDIEGVDLEIEDFDFNINNLEPADDEENIKFIEDISDPRVLIKKHGCIPLTSRKIKIWQFIFYYSTQSEKINKYFKEISDCSNLKSDVITKKDLESIINDARFSKIAKSHGVSNSDINNTSLLLYHSCKYYNQGGVIRRWREVYLKQDTQKCNHYFGCHNHENSCNCGDFYCGDVNLKLKYSEIMNYYGTLIQDVAVLQVPHHGSIENWHDLLSMDNPGMLHIISSKFDNPKGLHPNNAVLYQITKYQGIIVWCNDKNEAIIHGNIWLK